MYIGGAILRGLRLRMRTPIGGEGSRALASALAMLISMLTVYGASQSFLLRLDQFAMFVFLWVLIAFVNQDCNRIETELG